MPVALSRLTSMPYRFAVECKTGIEIPSRATTVDQGVNALAELFGLSHVLNTHVDRVSGGERRRVSLAETLATQAKYGASSPQTTQVKAHCSKTPLLRQPDCRT